MKPQYLLILITVLLTNFFIRRFRNKIYNPQYENEVQNPGKLEKIIAKIFIVLDILMASFAIIGLLMKETEMAIVFGILTLVFMIITFVLKKAQDISYQETKDYFIARVGKKEQKVYYNDIIDWRPSNNEIAIIDQTQMDKKPIRVNLLIFKPEILLRKMTEMAFAGKFDDENLTPAENEEKRIVLVNYLVDYQYDYLIEDYVEQIESEFE